MILKFVGHKSEKEEHWTGHRQKKRILGRIFGTCSASNCKQEKNEKGMGQTFLEGKKRGERQGGEGGDYESHLKRYSASIAPTMGSVGKKKKGGGERK